MAYIAIHIHTSGNNFTKLIDSYIINDIYKFDSSMCGIGGYPFAEDKSFCNISTVKLITFLKSVGYCNNIDLPILKYNKQ